MKRFAELYRALDETNKTNAKIAALEAYFRDAPPADAAWAVYFLIGRKVRQIVPTRSLRQWSAEVAGIPDWLFDESYEAVGDLAETMALILPPPTRPNELPLAEWVQQRLLPLRRAEPETQRAALIAAWQELDAREKLTLHKLLTGAFRVGVSQRLVTRALAQCSGLQAEVIAHRLMGDWEPTAEFYQQLVHPDPSDTKASRPYPFYLAHPLEGDPESLGQVHDWLVEWKWDGIRAQLIRRRDAVYIWSRGEELVTERFPELQEPAHRLPDGMVLDGEILAWKEGRVLPFAVLQRRIGRKQPGKKILAEAPVSFMAFDLLEFHGQDVRAQPLQWRREQLEQLLRASLAGLWTPPSDAPLQAALSPAEAGLLLSPQVLATDWQELYDQRQMSRDLSTEGLMLKRLDSPYRVGRPRGDWWKWKIEPYSVDAVLIYAQRGTGRRANLYTDYTFAVWDEGQLVPFAKAYSGLTDSELRQVDRFVRRNTQERFGPVRSVKPELVFELAFENIQRSTRHKSGVAVRFPRIVRWRHDKRPEEADTLAIVQGLIRGGAGASPIRATDRS